MLVVTGARARAQTAPVAPGPARFATEIVVTPERGETPRQRVPAATVVIDKAALAALPVTHPSETISFLSGFSVKQGEFHAGRPVTSARGFFGGGEAEYVVLLVNGAPVADAESGLIDWSLVPVASIERIEAARGPGASMYGDAAIGGVIQILTDQPANTGQLTVTGGSFDSFIADGAYGWRSRGLRATVYGAARTTSGAFAHSSGRQLVGTTSLEGTGGGASWRWTGSADTRRRDDPGSLTVSAFEHAPRASDRVFRFDEVDRHGLSTAFVVRHASAPGHPQARLYVRGRNEDLVRTVLLAPGLGDTRARALSSLTVGASVDGQHASTSPRVPLVRFGIDISRDRLDTSYFGVDAVGIISARESAANATRLRAGMFVSATLDLVPRLRLSGAVRWDAVNDNYLATPDAIGPDQRAWSPRAGIVVQVSDKGAVVAFAQASRAFKAPTLDQLADQRPYPDFQGGTFTISNPTLTPQRAVNIEAGLSAGGPLRWSALVYRMSVDDEIDFDLRTFSYANIGKSRHVGAEFEAEGRWWRRVRPSAAYTLVQVSDVSGRADLQLKNIPRHVVSAGVSMDLPWSLGVVGRYHHTAGGYLDAENAFPLEGPTTFDLRIRRPAGRHSLFVDVLNATDNVYQEYGYTLTDFRGRTAPYVYAGAGRAVRAGATLVF